MLSQAFSRRQLVGRSTASLGTLFMLAELTGIPIPLLRQLDRSIALGQSLTPLSSKMFILIQTRSGVRPNDFNIHSAAQPEFLDRNWTDDQMIAVTHGDATPLMFPPGIGELARFGDRMSVLIGYDTLNNGHGGGNRNATTNVTAGAAATSLHTIIGEASGMVLPGIAFSGTNNFRSGAESGGVSVDAFLSSLEPPPSPSEDIVLRRDQFRDIFHREVIKKLSAADQKVLDQYWSANGSFKETKERAEALFNSEAPDNNLLGQLQLSKRVFDAGLSNSFLVNGGGGFDTHGGNGPQVNRSQQMAETIATFLDELNATGDLDRVNIVVTSAFGRNPSFNGNGGDDHLPSNGHATLIGPDFRAGSFGKTTNTADTRRGVTGWAVNLNDGTVGSEPNPGTGYKVMTPADVNKSIGFALGVSSADLNRWFPSGETLKFISRSA